MCNVRGTGFHHVNTDRAMDVDVDETGIEG
jgi:hypothetical protein